MSERTKKETKHIERKRNLFKNYKSWINIFILLQALPNLLHPNTILEVLPNTKNASPTQFKMTKTTYKFK